MNFAAIDFETANRHRSSICAVGVVVVEDAVVTERFYELVMPEPNGYSRFNTAVHGIRFWDTANARTFPEVWNAVFPKIKGLPLVAHNSPFDEGCLVAAHAVYGMAYPGYRFHCTCRASRRLFPALPNHKLHTVSAHLGFDLKNHHHALADAEACAHIAMRVFQ